MTIGIRPAPPLAQAPPEWVARPGLLLAPAIAGLGTAGALHLVVAAALSGQPLLQLFFLLTALASIGTASFLVGLLLTGLRPFGWMTVLVLAGAGILVVLDLLLTMTDVFGPGAGQGLVGASLVAADAVAVLSTRTLVTGPWRRRVAHLLIGIGGLAWALWLGGVAG